MRVTYLNDPDVLRGTRGKRRRLADSMRARIPVVLRDEAVIDVQRPSPREGWREIGEIADLLFESNWRSYNQKEEIRVGLLTEVLDGLTGDGVLDRWESANGWVWWRAR